MPFDKGPLLPGARIEDADFSNARLHAPNFEGVRITDAWFYGADISGDLEGLTLNGVEVAPLVEAELERREPERAKLRAADPVGLAEAWVLIEQTWQNTVELAKALPEKRLNERVDDEWSFVETSAIWSWRRTAGFGGWSTASSAPTTYGVSPAPG
jgi:hypothetical protein